MELSYAHIKQVALRMVQITIVIFFLYEKGALQHEFWPSAVVFIFSIFVGKFNFSKLKDRKVRNHGGDVEKPSWALLSLEPLTENRMSFLW